MNVAFLNIFLVATFEVSSGFQSVSELELEGSLHKTITYDCDYVSRSQTYFEIGSLKGHLDTWGFWNIMSF